ncbi:hypothetical protein Bca4012_076079 [Brassica carinata]
MSGGTNMHLSRILYAAALGTTPSSQHWIMHPRRHASGVFETGHRIHPRLVFSKRAIPRVTSCPDRRNLQETRLSNFLRQVQLLPCRHTHPTAPCTNPKVYRPRRASASKREMSWRTAIPETSSSTPESSQGQRNKKTVVPMETVHRAKKI